MRAAEHVEDAYPLSPLQEGMLFHSLMNPGSGTYVEQFEFELRGPVEAPFFDQAWQQVTQRHPILRTAFAWMRLERPLQLVGKRAKVPVKLLDWREFSPADQSERLTKLLHEDRMRGFSLTRAPLSRVTLVWLAAEEYRLVWSFHHLLLDGWSVPVVLQEVLTCYDALCNQVSPQLKPARPYRDYIDWLQRQDLSEAERFWRQRLSGLRHPTPLVRELGSGAISAGAEESQVAALSLSADVTAELHHIARIHRLTLNTVVHGAWAVLLSRYSGEPDVVFGATSSGRPEELLGVESMVGCFINTLPVRATVRADALLLPWLHDLQEALLETRRFEYTPLVHVQGWSEMSRSTPLFDNIVVFENRAMTNAAGEGGGRLELVGLRSNVSTNYAVNLVVIPGEQLTLEVIYDERRVSAGAVSRLLGHMGQLLKEIAAAPSRRIGELPLLTEPERQQILIDWNQTATDFPKHACIHQLFEAIAAESPDAIALVCDGHHLTYREVNARANQVAHELLQRGIRSGDLVALCTERSWQLAVAIIGTLKAGAAYLPLDPNYPEERLRFMLADAEPGMLITQHALLEKVPWMRAGVIVMDRDRERLATRSKQNPAVRATEKSLAYVMYTSGSTGRPKGVMVPHGAVVRLVRETNWAELSGDEIFLQHSPISFDALTLELWGPLLNGGRLVIMRPRTPTLRELAVTLRTQAISVLWLTAGLFHVMAEQEPAALNGVRQLLAGGDVLSVPHVKKLLSSRQVGRLINGYGPTENTTFTSYYPMEHGTVLGEQIPIGRPVANSRVYLLDPSMQPVPVGVPGQLYTGGHGLADGYLNRPALTAERFVPNPFMAGERLYRTGDLARYREDGTIEFLGREDNEVKIRGFRIELGEIETVVGEHPAVKETVVVAREEQPGDKRLVAYVVAGSEHPLAISELKAHVAARLPDYMVPAAWVEVAVLPLTPNGKVDRAALPAPDRTQMRNQPLVHPSDSVQLRLAQLWEDLLGVAPVGIQDDFFALGGHSLLAVTLMSRIAKEFGCDLPLSVLARGATVEHVARILHEQGNESPLVPIQPGGSRPPFFCVHPGGGTVLCYVGLARHLGPDQPFYALEDIHRYNRPDAPIREMAAAYVDAIRQVQPHGPYRLGGWSFGGVVAYEMAHQLRRQGERVDLLAVIDSPAPALAANLRQADDTLLLAIGAVEIVGQPQENVGPLYYRLRGLSASQQLEVVRQQMQEAGVIPADTGPEWVERELRLLKGRYRSIAGYDPPPCDGEMILYRAITKEIHRIEGIPDAIADANRDPTLGWPALAPALEVVAIPGDHGTLLREPHVQALAEALRTGLR